MNNFLNQTKKLILTKQGSMFSSAILIAGMIILSRIFGFLRYRILATYFSKDQLDIFFAAFRIPDLIFEILISGSLSSAFIPLIIKYQKDKEKFSLNISSIINLILLVMFLLVLLLTLFSDKIIPLVTLGYSKEKIQQITYFSKILLIGQIPLLVCGNLLIGLAQAYKFFILTTLAPILYNIFIILFTIFLSSNLQLQAPVIGVIVGAFFFFISQIPILFRIDFKYLPIFQINLAVKEFVKVIIPRLLTVLTAQIDATVDLTLTTFLGSGSYTVFYFAQHLQLLPVSVIGMAFGQASLPYISELFQQNKIEELKKIVFNSILNLLFLTIPTAAFFIFCRTPLIRLIFGGEKFDWSATVLTAYTLSAFSLSLPFHSIYYFITRCFYAILDTKTPFLISAGSILFNTFLSIIFIFIFHLPVWSLGLSFSLSITLSVVILSIIFFNKFNFYNQIKTFFGEVFKILIVALIASILSYLLMKILSLLILDLTRTINIFILVLIVGFFYYLLYLFLCWFFEIKELSLISHFILKAKEYKRKIIEIYNQYD